MKRYSIAEARDKFTTILKHVEQAAPVEVTRRGEPVAVILSKRDYENLRTGRVGYWEAYEAFRARYDLSQLALEDSVFADLRDRTPGREVHW